MHGEVLMLGLILAAALIGGRLAVRFGYPAILGELGAGIVLGPPLLGILSGNEAVTILGEVGVLLMMLYIGMHLDLSDLKRASVPGLLAAIGGFLVPAGLGYGLMVLVGFDPLAALFVGLAMGVTSLATKSRILVDLRILDTRIAHVLMAGALISDMAVLVVFAAVVGADPTTAGVSLATAGVAGIKALAFGLGAWIVGSWFLPRIARRFRRADLDRGAALLAVIIFGLGFAWMAELAGLHAILGAFVAGLFLDDEVLDRKVSRDVERRLATVSVGVLAPFFFVSAGFQVTLDVFRTDLGLLVAVIAVATIGKIIGTALFYLASGNGLREGLVVGAGMNGRGAVEIIVAEIALVAGLIDQQVFSILVFMALFTTATVPVLLTMGVRWLRRRGELVRAGDRSGAVVVGAGPIARVVARLLAPAMPVVLLDTNPANQAEGRRLGLDVQSGSGLDEVALEEAGIDRVEWLIAATPNAEVNVLTAQLAVNRGVPSVAAVLRPDDPAAFRSILTELGVGTMPGPRDVAEWEHAVTSGAVEEESVVVEDASSPADIDYPGGAAPGERVLPLVVVSTDERRPFTVEDGLDPGDTVVVLARADRPVPTRDTREPTP